MLYVIGGGDRFSAIEAYDPISDSWVIKNDYNVGFLVRAITVSNVIYILGDEGEFWKYTPSNDAWETLPDDLKAIVELGCQAINLDMQSEYNYGNAVALQQLMADPNVEVRPFPDDVSPWSP